jgi:hypothetical protein
MPWSRLRSLATLVFDWAPLCRAQHCANHLSCIYNPWSFSRHSLQPCTRTLRDSQVPCTGVPVEGSTRVTDGRLPQPAVRSLCLRSHTSSNSLSAAHHTQHSALTITQYSALTTLLHHHFSPPLITRHHHHHHHHSPLTTHHSPLTTHLSPLTIHHHRHSLTPTFSLCTPQSQVQPRVSQHCCRRPSRTRVYDPERSIHDPTHPNDDTSVPMVGAAPHARHGALVRSDCWTTADGSSINVHPCVRGAVREPRCCPPCVFMNGGVNMKASHTSLV